MIKSRRKRSLSNVDLEWRNWIERVFIEAKGENLDVEGKELLAISECRVSYMNSDV